MGAFGDFFSNVGTSISDIWKGAGDAAGTAVDSLGDIDLTSGGSSGSSGLLGNGDLNLQGNSSLDGNFAESGLDVTDIVKRVGVENKLSKSNPNDLAPDTPGLHTTVAESTGTQGSINDAVGEGSLLDAATDDFFNENAYGESSAEANQRFEDNIATYGTNDLAKIREFNEASGMDRWYGGSKGDINKHAADNRPKTRKDLKKMYAGKTLGALSSSMAAQGGLQQDPIQYSTIGQGGINYGSEFANLTEE